MSYIYLYRFTNYDKFWLFLDSETQWCSRLYVDVGNYFEQWYSLYAHLLLVCCVWSVIQLSKILFHFGTRSFQFTICPCHLVIHCPLVVQEIFRLQYNSFLIAVSAIWSFVMRGEIVKVKVKFPLEQAIKAQRGSRGIAILFLLTLALDGGGCPTPYRGRFIQGKRLSAHRTEGWAGLEAAVDRYGKSRPHRSSSSGESTP